MSETDKTSLLREEIITDDLTIHHANATFIDGDDKDYTYHEKRVEDGTIVLYEYDTTEIGTTTTDFHEKIIEDEETGKTFKQTVPYKPIIRYEKKIEKHRISLETCKDFTPTDTTTETVTYENWSAVSDMPREAALAYQRHFGEENCKVGSY